MSTPSRRTYTIITATYQYLNMAIALVIGVFLVPVYLHYIPVATYGLWLATGSVLMWVSLVDPGLAYVLQQQAARAYGERDLLRVGALCGTGTLLNIGLIVLFLGVALPLGLALPWIVTATDKGVAAELQHAFMISAIGGALNLLSYVFRCSNQALHAAIPVGVIDLTVKISGTIVLIVALRHGWGLCAFGFLALWSGMLNSVGNGFCLWALAKKRGIRFLVSRSVAGQLVGLVTFNFAGRLANIVQSLDLLLINIVLGAEITAIYGLTRRVPDFLRPLIVIPVESAGPSLSHLVGEGDTRKLRRIVIQLAVLSLWLAGLAAAGCLSLNGAFVRLWVGAQLFAGTIVSTLICLQMTAYLIILAFSAIAFYLGDVRRLSLVALVRSLLIFVLLYLGAKVGGLQGAAAGCWVATLALAWYPLVSMARLAKLNRSEITGLLREALRAAAAAGIAILCAIPFACYDWKQFVLCGAVVIGSYVLALAVLSPTLRTVASSTTRGLRQRVCPI